MMQSKLSAAKADYLKQRFLVTTFNNGERNINAIQSLDEPIELYFLAKYAENDNNLLLHIATHPDCEIATAKMMFFRADIEGFLKYGESSKDFFLISTIMFNFQDGLYKKQYFHYDYREDPEAASFDFSEAQGKIKIFSSLIKIPARTRVEYSILDHFHHRHLKFYPRSLDCKKSKTKLTFNTEYFKINFAVPSGFSKVDEKNVDCIISLWNFTDTLNDKFHITGKSLEKVLTRPTVLKSDKSLLIFYIFNAKPFTLNNTLKNVAVMMQDELSYLEEIVNIADVETACHKIRRFKQQDSWFAISAEMLITSENTDEKYLRIIFMEREDLLFSLYIIADNPADLSEDKMMEIIGHFSIT